MYYKMEVKMEDILRNLQLVQLEMLKIVDNICKKNNIKYSLYAGTLLGAVRHRGFIPWDDDLDICMLREEYDKFIIAWNKDKPQGYILQNKDNTPNFTQSFTKIRKKNTIFLQEGELEDEYYTGIFIDIFPIDRMPSGKLKRYIFIWNCLKYQLLTREYPPVKGRVMEKLISKILLTIIPKEKRAKKRKALLKKIICYNNNKNLNTVAIEIVSTIKMPLPIDLLDEYVELQFEDSKFLCFKKWDEYLKLKYNNYMEFPPEEDRLWKHLPIKIEFNNTSNTQ